MGLSRALAGSAATSASGTVTATSGLVVALTGQAATMAAGIIVPARAQALQGAAAVSTSGSVLVNGAAVDVPLAAPLFARAASSAARRVGISGPGAAGAGRIGNDSPTGGAAH